MMFGTIFAGMGLSFSSGAVAASTNLHDIQLFVVGVLGTLLSGVALVISAWNRKGISQARDQVKEQVTEPLRAHTDKMEAALGAHYDRVERAYDRLADAQEKGAEVGKLLAERLLPRPQ